MKRNLLQNTGCKWVIAMMVLLFSTALYGQQIINGTVVSADDNHGLESVSIVLKGSTKGTATDKNGKFRFSVSDKDFKEGSLVFSILGFYKRDVKINGRSSFIISLAEDNQELKNVVVTSGYGRPKRKEEVVGAISSITSKELQTDRPLESFDKMLEGLVSGVQVQTNTELGTPVKINIRGQNSISEIFGANRQGLTTSSQPLFVIDGVPIAERRKGDEPIQFGDEQFLNPLAGINPDDIESISVLKDAAAAAVYGANASNGVVIITTKKGRPGRTKLNVGFSAGISNPVNRIKWLNGQQYHTLIKELYINEGTDPATAEKLAGSNEINTDWFGITNRTGVVQNYDMDLSGGTEQSQFRISASFLNQQSIQLGNDYQQAYLTIQLNNQLTPKLTLTTKLAPTITRKNGLTVYSDLTPIVPNIPTYNADGTYYTITGVPNPVAVLNQNTNYAEGGTLIGNMRLDYSATKNLRISGNIGTNIGINKQNLYQSKLNETGRTKGGFATIYDRTEFNWIAFTQANWTPKIGNRHQFDIMTGFEVKSENTKLLRGSGTGFTYYRLNELSNASSQTSASSRQTSTAYSVYMQTAYNLSDKYFLNVTGRSDASSVFGTDVNTTINASAGAGWTVNKEAFLKDSKLIDQLRLRASFGTTGNSRIGSYEARGLYSFNNTGYNAQATSDPVSIPNPGLKWEKSYKTNIGIDLGLLKRITIGFDWYTSILDDAISIVEIPYETGFAEILANTAKMKNSGFDASVTAQIFKGKFTWSSTLNLGYNQNKVLEVKNVGQRFGTSDNAVALKPGFSTGAIWGFRQAGVDPQTGVELFYDAIGKVLRADDNTPNIFSIQNSYVLGDRLPDLQGGFINNFSYAGLSVSAIFTYSLGNGVLANYRNEWNGNNLDNRNQSVNLLDRWQKPGDISLIPILNRQARSGYRFVPNSSRYLYDGTFLKLTNLSLSYALPKTTIRWLKASRVSVYVNGANLFYIYRQSGTDDRNGIKQYRFTYPEAQSFTGGIKISW
ncbi:MAG: SusC/RagA family TonB-linked outer membrane protein [Chitinophagaceae bacterium]